MATISLIRLCHTAPFHNRLYTSNSFQVVGIATAENSPQRKARRFRFLDLYSLISQLIATQLLLHNSTKTHHHHHPPRKKRKPSLDIS